MPRSSSVHLQIGVHHRKSAACSVAVAAVRARAVAVAVAGVPLAPRARVQPPPPAPLGRRVASDAIRPLLKYQCLQLRLPLDLNSPEDACGRDREAGAGGADEETASGFGEAVAAAVAGERQR